MSIPTVTMVILSWQGQNKVQEQTCIQDVDETTDMLDSSVAALLPASFAQPVIVFVPLHSTSSAASDQHCLDTKTL